MPSIHRRRTSRVLSDPSTFLRFDTNNMLIGTDASQNTPTVVAPLVVVPSPPRCRQKRSLRRKAPPAPNLPAAHALGGAPPLHHRPAIDARSNASTPAPNLPTALALGGAPPPHRRPATGARSHISMPAPNLSAALVHRTVPPPRHRNAMDARSNAPIASNLPAADVFGGALSLHLLPAAGARSNAPPDSSFIASVALRGTSPPPRSRFTVGAPPLPSHLSSGRV